MAGDKGSDIEDGQTNIVSLFGEKVYRKTPEGEIIEELDDDTVAAMHETADTLKKKITDKETDGVIVLMFSTNPEIKAETMICGAGVFKDIPGTIGMLELLKLDFAEMQAREDGSFD